MQIRVVREPWRPHPLAWIHRIEAGAIARELRAAGHSVTFSGPGVQLLRLSDPVMLETVRRLTTPYLGPGVAVMERCYDKLEATRIASANGIDCPATAPSDVRFPLIVKPRRGSDSIGVRIIRRPPVPSDENLIIQEQIKGSEVTVGVLHGRAGAPLRIELPPGTVYSFWRKYLLRPRLAPVAAPELSALALNIARIFQVDWAARVDLIVEAATGRARFIECDVAPLVGAGSAFAASLQAGGIPRTEQLRLLLEARRQ